MANVFLLIALLLSGLVVLLWLAGGRRLLNFVDYGAGRDGARINRYAAARLLLPVAVNLGCAWGARLRPELAVPLLFLTPLAILGAVVRIAAGLERFAD